MAPGISSWVDAPWILSAAQQESSPDMQHETRLVGPVATFLYAVRRAVLSPALRTRTQFCHNGEFCELVTGRVSLAGLPAEADGSNVQIDGVILDLAGSRKSEFTIWIDSNDPSGLPKRIEFHAKSYLRLTFEALPASEAETLPWLLKEEPA
jgi:hypothetical protein